MIQNHSIAVILAEISRLLSHQQADRFRVHAFAHAAEILDGFDPPVSEILKRQGLAGLTAIAGIGNTIAHVIRDIVVNGHSSMLNKLRENSNFEIAEIKDHLLPLASTDHQNANDPGLDSGCR